MSELDKAIKRSKHNTEIAAKVAKDPKASSVVKGVWAIGAAASDKDAKGEFDKRLKEKTGLSNDESSYVWGKG